MNLYALSFYVTAAGVLAATAIAITRRNLVQAVLYLILSFLGTALVLYLFGAPLLAALHAIIYAGAIMVVFLLVVTAVDAEAARERMFPPGQLVPAALIAAGYAAAGLLIRAGRAADVPLAAAELSPREFGFLLFHRHWLSVEIVSLLLLVGVVAVLLLAAGRGPGGSEEAP
ncbi:MAG: NADH-quinone oxidoreductase subunit J [Deltaproteobacteria bacterium]|nr:NADH-quinone oxidoreductase subunit J [Deltaproteobacteria bacterium]